MKKPETDSTETPVTATKQETATASTKAISQGPFIYLGPPVRTGTLHLEPRQVLKQRPTVPQDLDFLNEFLVTVRDHGGEKQRLSAKYRATAKRLAAVLHPGKE